MASLNTLRTKFGVILSIVIGGALLAFILSLKTEMGFSGEDPKVGEINGEKILYSEYLAAYEDVKAQMGGEAYTDQQAAQLLSATWQNLMADHVLTPGFEELGLSISEQERTAMLKGERHSNVYSSLFTNPQTGQFDVAAVAEFLSQVKDNPQAQKMWSIIDKQAKLDRSLAKYMALIRNSAYANKLEIERGVKGANTTFGGRYVAARYNTIADSLVTVSDAEIKQYYKQHKNLYKQTPYRTISYVEFDVLPTEADKEQIAEQARIATEEFAAAADLKTYVRDNRHASIAQSYVTSTQMTAAEAEALTAGKVYGPELVGNEWRASRVVATRNVADSLTLKHIVLSYTDGELADSLMTAIGRGASFEELASQHSIATETASTGGEIGTIAYSTLAPEFADALNGKRAGETVKVVFGNVIQLMKVVKTGKVQKHYQVASLVYPIEPSQDTKRAIHTEASTFAVAAKGSQKNFDQAAADQNLTPRSANIEDSERMVRGLNGSTLEIVRWANDAKVGDVSELIKIDNNYVVAVLTGVNDEEYKSVEEVTTQIRNTLLRDKKFEQIAAKMQGATIDEIATSVNTKVSEFNGVKLGAYYIPGIGVEPRVLGTITAQQTGTISAPIKGASGVYVVVVDETTTAPELQTAEQEKVKAQAEAEQNVARRLMYAVQEMSDIKDESVKYF